MVWRFICTWTWLRDGAMKLAQLYKFGRIGETVLEDGIYIFDLGFNIGDSGFGRVPAIITTMKMSKSR